MTGSTTLHVAARDGSHQSVVLRTDLVRVGSSPDADVILRDSTVPPIALLLALTPDGCLARPQGLVTLDNRMLMSPTMLDAKAVLRVGRYFVAVRKADAPCPFAVPPPRPVARGFRVELSRLLRGPLGDASLLLASTVAALVLPAVMVGFDHDVSSAMLFMMSALCMFFGWSVRQRKVRPGRSRAVGALWAVTQLVVLANVLALGAWRPAGSVSVVRAAGEGVSTDRA